MNAYICFVLLLFVTKITFEVAPTYISQDRSIKEKRVISKELPKNYKNSVIAKLE